MMNQKPVMLWDGDCQFCEKWIKRWNRLTGDTVVYMTYQSGLVHYPHITLEACQNAIQFIDIDGSVYPAAAGVLRSLKNVRGYGWLYTLYWKSSLFAKMAEAVYRWVARNRDALFRIF